MEWVPQHTPRQARVVWGMSMLALWMSVPILSAHAQPLPNAPASLPQVGDASVLAHRFSRLTRTSEWQRVREVPLAFPTYHPQGLVKVGDHFFLSSVEVTIRPEPLDAQQGGYDRTTGAGVAHLFRFDARGALVDAIELGEGALYHPGGIDYDGRYLWVPVAEYRRGSRSIIYRVDPETMDIMEAIRFDDHIGAVVSNPADRTLTGMNWDARRFYTWPLTDEGLPQDTAGRPARTVLNRSSYIAYQDCQHAGAQAALCGGQSGYDMPGAGRVVLGGLELVDLTRAAPLWQLPLSLYARPGVPMTRNPFYAEPVGEVLRFFFIPEDDESSMYVYQTTVR